MEKYRKKPVVIEAEHLQEPNTPEQVAAWCKGRVRGVGEVGAKVWIEIDTLEGTMRADYSDYVIRGIKGEFYPCKSDIFHATYDVVADETTEAQSQEADREILDALIVAANDLHDAERFMRERKAEMDKHPINIKGVTGKANAYWDKDLREKRELVEALKITVLKTSALPIEEALAKYQSVAQCIPAPR